MVTIYGNIPSGVCFFSRVRNWIEMRYAQEFRTANPKPPQIFALRFDECVPLLIWLIFAGNSMINED